MEKEQVLSGLLIQRSSRFLLMVGDTLVPHRAVRSQLCLSDCPGLCPVLAGHPCPVLLLLTPCWQHKNKTTQLGFLPLSEQPQHNSTKFHLKL